MVSPVQEIMAPVPQPVVNDPATQLNLECKMSINTQHASESELSVIIVPKSESKVENKLDIDELHEFHAMCTRTSIRAFITQLITCLGIVFSHVNSIKVTTNRNYFTTHGLHLNRVGKELLVKELINHLPNRRCSPTRPSPILFIFGRLEVPREV
jgi:hypothetical protein